MGHPRLSRGREKDTLSGSSGCPLEQRSSSLACALEFVKIMDHLIFVLRRGMAGQVERIFFECLDSFRLGERNALVSLKHNVLRRRGRLRSTICGEGALPCGPQFVVSSR
jgi:hypothetical protein